MNQLLARMGKTPLTQRTPTSASSAAFDAIRRSSIIQSGSGRAEVQNQIKYDLNHASSSPTNGNGRSTTPRFLGHDERLTLEDMMDDNLLVRFDDAALEYDSGVTLPKQSPPPRTITRARSSPRLQHKTASPTHTAAVSTISPTPTSSSPTKLQRSKSHLQPRTLNRSLSPAITRTATMQYSPPPTASSSPVSMKDARDDDDDVVFTFSADGPLARHEAAEKAAEEKRAVSRALAASMNKRKRSVESNPSTTPSAKRPSPTKGVMHKSPHQSRPVMEEEPDPFEIESTPSPATNTKATIGSPAVTSSSLSPSASGPNVNKPIPTSSRALPFENDPFESPPSDYEFSALTDIPVSSSTSTTTLASITTTTTTTTITTSLSNIGVPPAMPILQATNRTASVPGSMPAHMAVAMMGFTPKPAPSSPTNTPTAADSSNSPTITGTPTTGAPSFDRMPSNELLDQRRANLSQKSYTTLLIEALLGKTSPELKEIENLALTPAQRVLLQKRPSSTTTPPTFVTLASKLGRKLKAKAPGSVGYNAKQRSRGRRADGFLADMTPVLERVISYLLANGADPNGRDADRNHALWLALQFRGSERVIKMLLDRGAECVNAEESEDESSDEDENGNQDGDNEMQNRGKNMKQKGEQQKKQQLQVAEKDQLRPELITSTQKSPLPSTHPLLPPPSTDRLNYERGSTVDLAMKLGSDRHVLMLLRAGHRPSRQGQISLMTFAKLHGFANEANQILVNSLWDAVRQADPVQVADAIRHIDRRMIDTKDQTGKEWAQQLRRNRTERHMQAVDWYYALSLCFQAVLLSIVPLRIKIPRFQLSSYCFKPVPTPIRPIVHRRQWLFSHYVDKQKRRDEILTYQQRSV